MTERSWRLITGLLLALLLLVAGTINLESTPPPWWDEGWNLSVARNWVEIGHYGRLLAAEPTSPGLQGSLSIIAPVALSFRSLGIGIWQGRLVTVFFMLGAIALLYYLAARLYDRSVAIAALAVLLLMSPHSDIHAVLMGRQVLGEIPMLFYLLAGYTCFLHALQRSVWFIGPTVFFWGIALVTKVQAFPFFTVSLMVPLLMTLRMRQWNAAGLIATGLVGSLGTSRLLLWLQEFVLASHTMPRTKTTGLYDVVAFVPSIPNRALALLVVLIFAWPTLVGLYYAIRGLKGNRWPAVLELDSGIVRLAVLALVGSWFAWYVCLSNGVPRYIFPATFLGAIFVAALLRDLTNQFDLSSMIRRGGYRPTDMTFIRRRSSAFLAMLLIVILSLATLRMLYRAYFVGADASLIQVADFLNAHTAANSLVETYDSEIFVLLDRPYHYPPDQLHVELIRRALLGQDVAINYDPLAADPDYLVVGPYSSIWRLYEPVLKTGAFRLLRTYSRYDLYERIR